MATGVVIRLRNLPLVAGTIDIRRFFNGLRIPDGGVHIIGGDDGTAFILFSTDEDARRAMLQDEQSLRGAKIKLMLSSHTEMKTVIEQSQRICEKLRGKRPPEPPITNLSSQSTANNYPEKSSQYQVKPKSPEVTPELLDVNDVYIEIKGMPYSVNKADITYFFTPLSVLAIKFMLDEKGRKNGSGYIKFATPLEKLHGLKRDRKYIGSRFVKLSSVTERQWLLANSQPNETVRLVSDNSINRKRQQSIVSPEDTTPKRSRALSPLKTDNCVEVRGLPSSATFKDVGDLFSRLKFVDGGLFVEMDANKCKGIAYVEFSSYSDYKQALEKDGDMVNGRQVRVVSMSKQNMLDQISRHKKLCKIKREEQQEKETRTKESRTRESENQHKRKDRHSRKQKEMEEWLQRQHQKEQNERKQQDANEKQAQQQAEEMKQLQLLLSDKSFLESLKASEEFRLGEELKQKILLLTGQPTGDPPKVEPVEEPLQGAGEMDIEDDPPVQQPILTQTENKVQHNTTATQSVGSSVSFPMFGNSGSIMAPQIPVAFNSAVSLLNPNPPFPTLQGVNSLQPNIPTLPFSSGMFPIVAKPAFITTHAGSTSNPAPPLPPAALVAPPVPLPALSVNASSSVMQMPIDVNLSSMAAFSKEADQREAAPFVRLANTPYNVTKDHLRQFFKGLTIPEGGIQFVNKNNRRSGHIFVKFATNEEATAAAYKNDLKLLGRKVLVKTATLPTLAAMYKRITKGDTFIPTFPEAKLQSRTPPSIDNVFTKRILDDRMTCVCIGNVPPTATEDDIVKLLDNIKFVQNRIFVLRDLNRNCKGDVYVELQSPEDCVKAANLHEIAKVGEQVVRVLPLTADAMEKDVASRQSKLPPVVATSFPPQSNGCLTVPNPAIQPPPLLNNGIPPIPLGDQKPPKFDPTRFPFPSGLETPVLAPPNLPPPAIDPNIRPPLLNPILPPFDPSVMPPQSLSDPAFSFGNPAELMMPPLPVADGLMRLPPPQILDPSMGLPPVPNFPPPPSSQFVNRPPLNPNLSSSKTIKMSNLSYSVTREDILEFFAPFDPFPDSIRLMYNNRGKLTGDGIISFPNFQAAQAAIDQRNFQPFLNRKIRLSMQ